MPAIEPVTAAETAEDESAEARLTVVTREELGEDWPLTVDEGRAGCLGSAENDVIFIVVDGTQYALSDFVALSGNTRVDLEPIRQPNPQIPGELIGIGHLQERPRAHCDPP